MQKYKNQIGSFFLLFTIFSSFAYSPVRVGLISLPVSGTNLADKAIKLILEPLGGWDRAIPGATEAYKGRAHQIGSHENIQYALKNKVKIIFNVRDPRDRVVSYAYKIKKFHPHLKQSIENLSLEVIRNYGIVTYNYLTNIPFYRNMGDFSEYYQMYFPWLDYPDLLIVYFENLVGPKGNGTKEKQVSELQKIAQFLGVSLSIEQLEEIADQLYGGTPSFRSPQIGFWKDYFTKEHKKAFKRTVMKQFLIDFGYENDDIW